MSPPDQSEGSVFPRFHSPSGTVVVNLELRADIFCLLRFRTNGQSSIPDPQKEKIIPHYQLPEDGSVCLLDREESSIYLKVLSKESDLKTIYLWDLSVLLSAQEVLTPEAFFNQQIKRRVKNLNELQALMNHWKAFLIIQTLA